MLTHSPEEIIEQFLSQPNSFVNFLEENYLAHFSCADHADKAASALSEADFMLAEWRVGTLLILKIEQARHFSFVFFFFLYWYITNPY